MGTVSELISDLAQIHIKEIALSVMQSNAKFFVMLNQAQMLEGKGKDHQIGVYSSGEYAVMKAAMNPLPGEGNVDLKLTGSFYRGMVMTMDGDGIEMDSTDSKARDLLDIYGGNIYGLNNRNMPIFTEDAFLPDFIAEIENKTGLKFE